MIIEMFTDGACSKNPGPGGWGVFITGAQIFSFSNDTVELYGGVKNTTNNRMELSGPLKGLRWFYDQISEKEKKENFLSTKPFPQGVGINVYSDSKYVINGITKWIVQWERNGWKTASKKAVENQDLWKKLKDLNNLLKNQMGITVNWTWVKGHAGIFGNEKADFLAQSGISSLSCTG